MKDRRVGIEFFYFLEIYFKSTFELAHGGTGFPLGDYGQIKTGIWFPLNNSLWSFMAHMWSALNSNSPSWLLFYFLNFWEFHRSTLFKPFPPIPSPFNSSHLTPSNSYFKKINLIKSLTWIFMWNEKYRYTHICIYIYILIRACKYSNTTFKWMFNKCPHPKPNPTHLVYWVTWCLTHGSMSSYNGRFSLGNKVIFFKAPRKSVWLNASAFSKTTGLGAQLSVWKVFFSSASELFSMNWTSTHLPETSLMLLQPQKFTGRKQKRFDPSHLCPW